MKKNKSFEIMKNNKKIQKKLNININDYKDYSQLYSPIEIELKIADNYIASPFIFLPDEDKKYYHIYFDNSNEEITRNYLNKNEKVKKIKIIIDYQIKSFKELFAYCYCISSIFFRKFYRINVINMGHMFYDCQSLIEIDLSNFHAENVTDISYMFSERKSLNILNISNFNTNKVIKMDSMFSWCSSLKN